MRRERGEAFHERLEALVAGVDEQRHVDAVEAGPVKGGVVDRGGHRVGHRLGDNAVDFGVGVQRIPAVEALHVRDRDLPGCGAAGRIE